MAVSECDRSGTPGRSRCTPSLQGVNSPIVHPVVRVAPPACREESGTGGSVTRQLTLCRVCFTLTHCGRQLSTRRVAGALRDRQESEGAAGPAQTLQKGDGCAPCCNGALRPEHPGLECAPIEGQSRGPARDGSQWPLAHHVRLGRQGRPRARSRAVSLNGRRRRWRRRRQRRRRYSLSDSH